MLADDAGLADYDPGTVVDEEPGPDLSARVDVDPRRSVRELGDDARNERDREHVQRVGNPVR